MVVSHGQMINAIVERFGRWAINEYGAANDKPLIAYHEPRATEYMGTDQRTSENRSTSARSTLVDLADEPNSGRIDTNVGTFYVLIDRKFKRANAVTIAFYPKTE